MDVGIEPKTSRSRVMYFTLRSPRAPNNETIRFSYFFTTFNSLHGTEPYCLVLCVDQTIPADSMGVAPMCIDCSVTLKQSDGRDVGWVNEGKWKNSMSWTCFFILICTGL